MKQSRPLRALFQSLGALLLLATGGCLLPGEGSREISFQPTGRLIEYQQDFQQAYAAPSSDGGYDVVLTRDLLPSSPSYSKRLYPGTGTLSSEALHIHVAWRPMRGSKSDYPAATNSTVDWYILDNRDPNQPGRVVYSGVGFVMVEVGEETSIFDLRDVTVSAKQVSGAMQDPFTGGRITGKIRARNDAQAVRRTLSALQERASSAPPDHN